MKPERRIKLMTALVLSAKETPNSVTQIFAGVVRRVGFGGAQSIITEFGKGGDFAQKAAKTITAMHKAYGLERVITVPDLQDRRKKLQKWFTGYKRRVNASLKRRKR